MTTDYAWTSAAGKLGGVIGSKNQPREAKVKGARIVNHVRWHVNRGIFKKECPICMDEFIGEIDAETEEPKS